MEFTNVREAQKYVREMSEAETAAIGDREVWEHTPTRDVYVGLNVGEEFITHNNADDFKLLGLVREVLY